jgi:hypothetical protein
MPKAKVRGTKSEKKVTIVLKVEEYEKLLDDLDELEAIRAYDAAKQSGEKPIPIEKALRPRRTRS